MSERTSWFSPSRVIAVAVMASVPAKVLSQRLADPDLWWHLRTGQLIAKTHSIPHGDVYSYTVPGREWVVQEWLSELVLHGLRKFFGLWGIFWWRAVMLTLIYFLVARLIHRRMGEGMGTWALFGLTAYAGSANWTERPNLFSFLLFVVLLGLVERRDRKIWWFVPLAALWANLHGMVILGIGTVAVVAATEGLKVAFGWEGADRVWARRLGAVVGFSALATLINPRGPALISYSFRLVGEVSRLVTEWASPNFHEVTAILFMALLGITIAALAMHPTRPDPTDLALALAFTVLGLQAARNLAIAGIVLGFVASKYIRGALQAIPSRAERPPRPAGAASPMMGVAGMAVAIIGLVVVVAADFPRSDRPADIVEEEYPVAALDTFVGQSGVKVFAFDVWGDYLIFTAWPGTHVYHDTRIDVYGEAQTLKYARTIAALPGWREALDESCTTHVLLRPRSDPLAEVLRLVDDWRVAREDGLSVTFARARPASGC